MGTFVRHTSCPKCDSSDAFAVYVDEAGTHNGTCFSCGHYEASLDSMANSTLSAEAPGYGEAGGVGSYLTYEMCHTCPPLPFADRGIRLEAIEFYGVRATLDQSDGITIESHLYPYFKGNKLTGYKRRYVKDKVFRTIGDCKDVDLFGSHLFSSGGRRVYITEGELDALSLFQVLKDLAGFEFKHLNPAVVSLPMGSKSVAKSLAHSKDFLDKFEMIVLCFDQDEAGQAAVAEACTILDPSKTYVARFTEKDANDMLLAGKEQELKWSCLNAQTYTPSGIATVDDLYEAAIKPPSVGEHWPWHTLTKFTYGRHPGLYGFGAGVGIGKTEIFHELMAHIVYEQRQPVGIFLLEEAPQRTIRIIGGKRINKPVHRPDCEFDEQDLRDALDELRLPNKVYIFDHRGDRNWKTIYHQCRHLISVHNVRDIFIDPLTAVISHEENTDRTLHAIMDDMSRLTQDPFNARIYFSSHLNEPSRDRVPHEQGGEVTEAQFAGSRAMVRFSDYIFGLERNKVHDNIVERNTVKFRILKDRRYGSSTGETFNLYYDRNTGRMQEFNSGF